MSESVVVIGNFDGVHRGHRKVLAEALGDGTLPLVVITFWPHPMSVLRPEQAPDLLADLPTRIELLREAGAHEVRVIPFNDSVSHLTPKEFVERYVEPLQPARVVVGKNFRFGHDASGDVGTLTALGAERGFEVSALSLESVGQEVTCSTAVRDALASGDVAEAAKHLGRAFRFRGVVVMGDQRGRELGFPTANLDVEQGMAIPADGIYAGWFTAEDGKRMPAAISVGSNPTFTGAGHRIESYVLDRTDLELYGQEAEVEFVTRLRGQVRFDGVADLIAQMTRDVAQCREILGVS